MQMIKFAWAIDGDLWGEMGIKFPLSAPLTHALFLGKTGSGKTTALRMYLYKLAKECSDATVILLDYKREFSELSDCKGIFFGEDCAEGMASFERLFRERLEGRVDCSAPLLLVAEEWLGMVNAQERKVSTKWKTMLNGYTLLGRSLNTYACCCMQRPDISEAFTSGATRDQFGVVCYLGAFSPEGFRMAFPGEDVKNLKRCGIGEGYLSIEGSEPRHIRVPWI